MNKTTKLGLLECSPVVGTFDLSDGCKFSVQDKEKYIKKIGGFQMKSFEFGGWIHYFSDRALANISEQLDDENSGKWMFFFNDQDRANKLCEKLISENILDYCKCRDTEAVASPSGVICMYCDKADINAHKKIISFMIENDMIKRTKDGRLHNISFKLDSQTQNKEYKSNFKATIKLDDFVDLKTGNWIMDN